MTVQCKSEWCYNIVYKDKNKRRLFCNHFCYDLWSNYKRKDKSYAKKQRNGTYKLTKAVVNEHKWDRSKLKINRDCDGYLIHGDKCQRTIYWWEDNRKIRCDYCRNFTNTTNRIRKLETNEFVRGKIKNNCVICGSLFKQRSPIHITCSKKCQWEREKITQRDRRHKKLSNLCECRCFNNTGTSHLYLLKGKYKNITLLKVGIASCYSRIQRHQNKSKKYKNKIIWEVLDIKHFKNKEQAREWESVILKWKNETKISYDNLRYEYMPQQGSTELIQADKTKYRKINTLYNQANKYFNNKVLV